MIPSRIGILMSESHHSFAWTGVTVLRVAFLTLAEGRHGSHPNPAIFHNTHRIAGRGKEVNILIIPVLSQSQVCRNVDHNPSSQLACGSG